MTSSRKNRVVRTIVAAALRLTLAAPGHAQTPPAPPTDPTVIPATPRIVGADADAHGCRPSAGYTWSALRQTCLRLFESAIRLNPTTPSKNGGAILSAFVLFSDDTAKGPAELFLPDRPVLRLHPAPGPKPHLWTAPGLTLRKFGDKLTLTLRHPTRRYQGNIAR